MEGLKEILDQLPIALGQSLMNYAIIAIIYVVIWKIFKKRLLNWRIQLKERVNAKQIKSELINSIFTLLVSTLLVVVIYLLKSMGYTNGDNAKNQKSRCQKKLKEIAHNSNDSI
jgi:chromate transport protein ChrA